MSRSTIRSALFAIAVSSTLSWSATAYAQWLKYPTAGVPRTVDGKPNLSAASPRTPDGKPDFTGIWLTNNTNCAPSPDPESAGLRYRAADGQGRHQYGREPARRIALPAVAGSAREGADSRGLQRRSARSLPSRHVLRAYSLPHLVKFVQAPGLLLMLNEMNAGYRQVFTDDRPLPEDPVPSWQGYSSAVGRRYAGRDIDRVSRRPVDRLEWKRHDDGRQSSGAHSAARLRPSRDRGHGRRPQGVHPGRGQ